jgi:AcrR family transcriptional regulator
MLFVSTPRSEDLPPAPGFPARKPRRRALTREAIVDAALEVLDEGGIDGMNMRAVAERLGTGPASLYAHVSGKDELLALLIEKLAAEMPIQVVGAAPWQDQLKDAVRGIRRGLGEHRDLARASLGNIPTGPNAMRLIEALLGVLRDAGLPEKVIAYAVDILPLYATATAYEESLFQSKGFEDGGEQYIADLRKYWQSLPVDRFPNIVAMAVPLTTMDGPDDRFEFGLDALVRGIESMGAA